MKNHRDSLNAEKERTKKLYEENLYGQENKDFINKATIYYNTIKQTEQEQQIQEEKQKKREIREQ